MAFKVMLLILEMIKVQNVKWCMKTKLTTEIFWPTHTSRAQSVEHESDDPEVLDSILAGGNF